MAEMHACQFDPRNDCAACRSEEEAAESDTLLRSVPFVQHGELLTPGRNVDRVDGAAGIAQAKAFGYGDPESLMVVEYALMRWARGEEDGAERTALSGGIDYTSWRVIIAAATAAAEPKKKEER